MSIKISSLRFCSFFENLAHLGLLKGKSSHLPKIKSSILSVYILSPNFYLLTCFWESLHQMNKRAPTICTFQRCQMSSSASQPKKMQAQNKFPNSEAMRPSCLPWEASPLANQRLLKLQGTKHSSFTCQTMEQRGLNEPILLSISILKYK